jgi:hypothetical protein
MYVTSDMACSHPNSATPMTQAQITAQVNRVAKVGSKFTSGNAALSNLVQQLGGIGIGNPPGTTPRTTTPNFANSPACSTAVLPGGGIYGRRLPIPGGLTGQPMVQPDGTIALPSTTGSPAAPVASSGDYTGTNSPAPIPASSAGTSAAAMGQSASVAGGSSPGAGQPSTDTPSGGSGYCAQRATFPSPKASNGLSSPLLWGLLLLIIGGSVLESVLTGGSSE